MKAIKAFFLLSCVVSVLLSAKSLFFELEFFSIAVGVLMIVFLITYIVSNEHEKTLCLKAFYLSSSLYFSSKYVTYKLYSLSAFYVIIGPNEVEWELKLGAEFGLVFVDLGQRFFSLNIISLVFLASLFIIEIKNKYKNQKSHDIIL